MNVFTYLTHFQHSWCQGQDSYIAEVFLRSPHQSAPLCLITDSGKSGMLRAVTTFRSIQDDVDKSQRARVTIQVEVQEYSSFWGIVPQRYVQFYLNLTTLHWGGGIRRLPDPIFSLKSCPYLWQIVFEKCDPVLTNLFLEFIVAGILVVFWF